MKIKKTQNLVIIVMFLLSLPGSIAAQGVGNHCSENGGCYSYLTGSYNTFCGTWAGASNTAGFCNTFSGFHAGFHNTDGFNNTFLGFRAGWSTTTGHNNTFVGFDTGYSNTGSYNTFLGRYAGKSNTTGGHNTFLGLDAGYSNTIGTYNTMVGDNAGFANTGGQHNIFLGAYAGISCKNGERNIFLGFEAGNNNSGDDNVFIGYQAGFFELGSGKLYIANGKDPSDALIYGDFYNDKVGINTTTPDYELEVDGTICGNFCSSSDIRLKKDVSPIENALDQIARLRGVTFHWKDKEKENGPQVGVIAQEVEKVFPQVVSTGDSGYKSVAYSNLVAPLIEAVKELKAQNETLKARLEAIEKKLNH